MKVSEGYAVIGCMSDGHIGWTDEDDALVTYESLPEWHPALFVDVFRMGLARVEPEESSWLTEAFVTPESITSWGDFSRARTIFAVGLKISTTARYGIGAPDVAYVRLVETSQHLNHDVDAVPATIHVTLVWRPEIAVVPNSSWRVHAVGEMVDPAVVPRTAMGFDPRSLR
jgi:hypothetical protein